MKDSNPSAPSPEDSSNTPIPPAKNPAPWQKSKRRRISYLALPLIIMATATEFIILATGWRYQKVVCLPQGMGVTFFGIGPIGATILAVELLKLPLAIWTASRQGWQKGAMLVFGLPLICLLTFQLVKDMAVYEMGVALTPASQMLEKATVEEVKMTQLRGELAAIDGRKGDRNSALAALAAKKAKSEANLEESLKRNDESRTDAINLTDYQKKELAAVAERETTMIKQFDADAANITKSISDLRIRRDKEVAQTAKWNAEDARLDNAYKAKLADYTNKKAAYEKAKAHYDQANPLRRPFMTEPVSPGVAPERETNTQLKPTSIPEIDAQIKTKEAELAAVNTQRRTQVALVEADARALRDKFDQRSGVRRSETDRKRDELIASHAALAPIWETEEKEIKKEYDVVAPKADAIRAELDEANNRAEGFYEAREAAIKTTQVHRIATTVEIVRGLLLGQRPVSIKATAKERGDLYTDQISMVRVWVYPVLAFIIAFLPTLMVEIGFSTIFEKEETRPRYRVGFLGRRLHDLYVRAGRQKILRAERMTREAANRVAARDRTLAAKAAELKVASTALDAAASNYADQLKKQESEWRAKLSNATDALNRTVAEKEALVVMQQAEIERQIQLRPNAWSERLNQLRRELDGHRAAADAERSSLIQEQHKKLMEVSDDSKRQLLDVRREMNDAFNIKLTQVQEDAARELEKAKRHEKERVEQQQAEFEKTLQRREQELAIAFDARLLAEKSKVEQDARRREKEIEREFATNGREKEAHWVREVELRDENSRIKLKQEVELRCNDVQAQAERDLRDREREFARELDNKAREADKRIGKEMIEHEEALQTEAHQNGAKWQEQLEQVQAKLQAQIDRELRRRESEMMPPARRALSQLIPGVEW